MKISRRRELAETSMKAFAHAYFVKNEPLTDLCAYHDELLTEIDRALLPNQRFLGAFPREHGKTTICTKMAVVYAACRGIKKHIIIVSANKTEAEMKLDAVMDALSWPEIQADYGAEVLPMIDERKNRDVKNRSYEVVLGNGCLIMAVETMGKVRGRNFRSRRPDLFVFDDAEDDELVRNKEWNKRFIDVFLNLKVLNSLDSKRGSLIWTGTFLATDAPLYVVYHNRRRDAGKKDGHNWRRLTYKIYDIHRLDSSGKPTMLWPGRWTYELAQAKREEIGIRAFSKEYLNEPRADENEVFRADAWRFYDPDLLLQVNGRWGIKVAAHDPRPLMFHKVVMACDPAFGLKRENDYTAIVVLGKLPRTHKAHCLAIRRLKGTVQTVMKAFHEQYNYWRPDRAGIEEGAAQGSLKQFLSASGIPITGTKPTDSKKARIEVLSAPFERGDILLPDPEKDRRIPVFLEEAEAFPQAPHDDQLDAFAQAFELLGLNSTVSAYASDERDAVVDRMGGYATGGLR